jgi:hypothetical protein
VPGFEDEDDDEDEHEAPHEWRPRRVFRLFLCYSTTVPNIGCHFSSFVPYSRTMADRQGTAVTLMAKKLRGEDINVPESKAFIVPTRAITKDNVDEFWANLKKLRGH